MIIYIQPLHTLVPSPPQQVLDLPAHGYPGHQPRQEDWQDGHEGGQGTTRVKMYLDIVFVQCSDTAVIYFDDVRVPAKNIIGEEGGSE